MNYINSEDEGHLEGVNDASFHNTSNLYQQEEFVEVKHTIVDGGDRFSPTACVFDHYQELLWMGNHGVSISWPNGFAITLAQ